MDDGRCLLDVIDDPDALTSFLDKPDEFGLDSADLEEFSRYQQQSLLTHSQYATGPNPRASLLPETPSSVLMRLENISPPPIQNDTVLSLLGDRPFTPTSHKPQPSQAASRPMIDLGFGEQEGGEIKEIFPDFMMGTGQMPAGNNQSFPGGEDLFGKLGVKESGGGSVQSSTGKDDFSSIFSFEEESEKIRHAVPPNSVSSGNDVIQQSLMLSGVGDLSDDVPTQREEPPAVKADKKSAMAPTRQSIGEGQIQSVQPTPSVQHSNALPSSVMIQGGALQVGNTFSEHQKLTTKSIPQVAVVRPQTQPPPPQPQTQVLATQPVIDSQGQVINSQFLQAQGKVIVSGQQGVMPMQQTYVLNTKNIHPKLGISAPAVSKAQPPPQQGLRIMLAPQGAGNIQTIGGAPTGQTIQLNHGQAGAHGQQTVVLHNVQGAVQPAQASSVPVLQPVITIGATQGSFIFMTRPTTVLAPQQIQQLQTSGSGLATIQMPGQAIGSVVQPGHITVNQQQGGKQGLPVMQLVQSGVSGGKTFQTITLPQGYVSGGQTIVIQNPQGASNVLPIAQSQPRIVQSGTNQMSFMQSQQLGTYGKVQATPQLIQPKVVSTAQIQTKVGTVSSQSVAASTAYRTKDITYAPPSKVDFVSYQSQPTGQIVHTPSVTLSSSIGSQPVTNPIQPYVQSLASVKDEVQVIKSEPLPTSKSKPVETFRHKLYGKISTVQSESKQAPQPELQSSQAQIGAISLASQSSSSLQTILQKVQPHDARADQTSSAQLSQALSSLVTLAQPMFIQQNSPPANTIVTPSNVNAKGLPNQTQILPGNNGSVPALVQHPQLTAQNFHDSVSSAAVSVYSTAVVSTTSNTIGAPTKKTQLKKQNMFGSRPTAPVSSTNSSNFQSAFLKTLQGQASHVVVSSNSTSTTTSTSSILTASIASATAGSLSNQGESHFDFTPGSNMLGSNTNVTSSLENVISSSGMMSSAGGGVANTAGLMSALELKAKQMQESGMKTLAHNQQPMVSALQLKAQQMMTPQGASFNQPPVRPNPTMMSALQLKNAGHFQGQGVNVSGPANMQPMISALEVQQQIQRQGQGMNIAQQPGPQTRPMVSALQLQQMQRQINPANVGVDNAALMNQLMKLQQKNNATQAAANQAHANQIQAQAIANQSQIPRPPSTGQPLPSPQGSSRPPSVGHPLPSPQNQPLQSPRSNQSHRPPSVPLPSPQGMPPHRPPSAGQPIQSPQAMQPHRPPSAGQPMPSPQGRQSSRPPSVGHPLPSPQGQPLASPQGMPVQSPHIVAPQELRSPQNMHNSSSQMIQSNQSMFAPMSQNIQSVSGQQVVQGNAPVQSVQHGQETSQTSTKMMPQLLQAFDLLKRAQAAQAKGQSGAQEQAHYMQQFQMLLQKHPDLMKQLQHLKQKQQLAKQQQIAKQQQMGASMPASSFQQMQQPGAPNQHQFQQQQQQHVLSASADQAQMVATSILQATQNASAAHNTRSGGMPSSTAQNDMQQFVRPGSTAFATSMAQRSPDALQTPTQKLPEMMNPNYTPNVTIQAVNTGQKDSMQRLVPAQGSFLQNQQPPKVSSLKKKNPPPNMSMLPPPAPAPHQAPPNVSILPSQKQAPLGTVPSVTKEKDVFEFDDDDPVPVKVENKFSRKTAAGKASSGTVHHQPLPVPQNVPQGQASLLIEPTGRTQGAIPGQLPFVGSQANQMPPHSGQMLVTQSNSSQGSQLSRMLQSAPQMTPPLGLIDQKSGFQAGQAIPQGFQPGQVPQRSIQTSTAVSQGGQTQFISTQVAGTSINAGGSMQKDTNVASRRLQQLQQSQQTTSTAFKPKAKAKTSHFSVQTQQSLHSVQGFIRQLEGIINRTPKQEAMLQQLLDLQQKINNQAREKLEHSGTAAGAAPIAKGVPPPGGEKPPAGVSPTVNVKIEVTTAGDDVQNTTNSGTFSMAGPHIGTSGSTTQTYKPIAAATNIPTSSTNTPTASQVAGQYKVSNPNNPLSASSSAVATAASVATAAAVAAQASSFTPAPVTGVQQGASQPVASLSSIPIPVPGVQIPPASSSASTFQQIFTTNIVQLVGKNLTPQQQDVLRRLQDQLKNMTPQQQQEFYRQQQSKLNQGQPFKKIPDAVGAPVQPVQQPTSSTPIPKVQLSPVRAKPGRSKAKKKGSKASPKGGMSEEQGGKDVEILSPPPPPKAPTPPPASAEFIRERRDLDKYCTENIQFKTSFASYNEAIQRLLPYHVAHEKIPSKKTFKETESSFNEISSNLMAKKQKMLDKFQHLLYQESMIEVPSSENVMLGRLFLQDETAALQEERKRAEAKGGLAESLMPKMESNPDQGTSNAQAAPVEAIPEHSFAQPARVAPPKAEPRHKTNHDRIRRSATQGAVLQRQRQVSGDGDTSSSTEGQYQSSIVPRYGSSDEEEGSQKGASSGGRIRLRLTKSLLVESKVKSRDRSFTSESDDSVLFSPTKPKRRKSQLEALLSSDSLDSSDYSPSVDYRTKGSVWKVSDRSGKDLFSFQDGENPSAADIDAIMDEDCEDKDVLQEQMDSAVNSILFLQNTGGPLDNLRNASLADISFDQDDVFDSADDSAVFNLEDYANTTFLEENSGAAGLGNELTSMESDVEEAVRSIL